MPVTGQRWPPVAGLLGDDGSKLSWPATPPLTPSTIDDEFRTPTLNAKWTEVATPSGAGFSIDFDYRGEFLELRSPGAATNQLHHIRQGDIGAIGTAGVALTVTWRFQLTLSINTPFNEYVLSDTTDIASGNRIQILIIGSVADIAFQVFDNGATDFNQLIGIRAGCTMLVQYQRTAANVVSVGYSIDEGKTWRRVWNETKTWDVNYLHILQQGHTVAGSPSWHLTDYLRGNWFTVPTW